MNALCTLIIWGGMHYANPAWMEKQIPEWMWSRYEIYIAPYGTKLSSIANVNQQTTALIGFSAGGMDVLKNYSHEYALCVLLDPSTRSKYTLIEYGPNTLMFYNATNWGSMNKNLTAVAKRINETGGNAVSLDLQHADIPKYFFNHFKSDTE
jgi:hypothetical protein